MSSNFPPDPADQVSPKIKAAGLTSAIITVAGAAVLGAIDAITPEHFEALGIWSFVVYGGVIGAGATLAGYIKNDPLRR